MNSYLLAWYTHVICVALSITFFLVRGFWMLRASELLNLKVVKILPHVIDTVLLGSAIVLTVILSQYPLVHGWLTVKLLALIAYIVLGTIALKRGKTPAIRGMAFVAAIVTFGFIVSVAWYHHPMGILAPLIY
ncbi:MAG: SirB2 family protein [Pseudomonadales bacterium]